MDKLLSLTLILTISFVDGRFFKKNEKVVANIEHFATCGTEEDNRFKINLNTQKYNRTHTGVNMNITVYEEFNRQFEIDLELRLWGDGGWKRNFFHYRRDDACNNLYLLLGNTWRQIIDAAGANRGCPIKAGYYHFENFFIDVTNFPIMTMAGKYLFVAKIIKKNVPQLCFIASFSIYGVVD